MKTLQNLNVPKDTSAQFPFGTIQNETDTQEGTPVVRELYGDILTNLYKLLQITKETPTGDEDSDATQYQIINALKKLANSLNDIEQTLSITGSNVWTVALDLELLPNKYVFVARSGENYDSNETYTFKGSGAATLPASSPTGFSVNDEVLIIVDQAGVRMYSLTALTGGASEGPTFTPLGAPISYNNTDKMYYFESGKFYNETPQIFNIEETIQNELLNGQIIVCDALVYGSKLLVMAFDPVESDYRLYLLDPLNPTASDELIYSGFSIPSGQDNQPYIFADDDFIYITNDFNNSSNDNLVSKYNLDINAGAIDYVGTINMGGSFKKTTNIVALGGNIYTFVNGILNSYDRDTGAETNVFLDYTLYQGVIFNFNGSFYYSKDEVAAKWNI